MLLFVLAIAAIVVAIGVPISVEAFRRPRLEIMPAPWLPAGPTPWTFATVQVRNRPLAEPLASVLTRQAAQACVVDVDFYRWGTDERAMPTVHGRWTNYTGAETADRRYRDIPVSRAGVEVAIAVLREGEAAAVSSEADVFSNPVCRLDRGTYRVAIHVHGSSVDHEQVFKLEYLSDDFAQFRLQEIKGYSNT
jgi:hypothetical protein